MRISTIVILALILSVGVSTAHAVSTVTYALTVYTDSASYTAAQPIIISGRVSPNPGPNTAVFLQVLNPKGVLVLAKTVKVNASTGMYSLKSVTGGTPAWVSASYSVNATWGAYRPTRNARASFTYAAPGASESSTTSAMSASPTASATFKRLSNVNGIEFDRFWSWRNPGTPVQLPVCCS